MSVEQSMDARDELADYRTDSRRAEGCKEMQEQVDAPGKTRTLRVLCLARLRICSFISTLGDLRPVKDLHPQKESR
jgi:hypothetical protein